jgi:hypothetical protein
MVISHSFVNVDQRVSTTGESFISISNNYWNVGISKWGAALIISGVG